MNLRTFRWVALLEATSFLALLVASVIKRTADNELGVQILGPLHGLLFVAYIWLAWVLRNDAGWTGKQTFWIMVGAVLPFGGYVVDWWLAKRERQGEAA
jgi:integral membrane protein